MGIMRGLGFRVCQEHGKIGIMFPHILRRASKFIARTLVLFDLPQVRT